MRFWGGVALAAATVLHGASLPSVQISVSPPGAQAPRIPSLISISVPYDPSEVVIADAQLVQNAEQRAATLELLLRAQRLSNVRSHAYDLKTTFTSYGSLPSDGRWILEDTSPGANIYRWTAQGPSFAGVFLLLDRLLSSNEPSGAVPLRLAQVRSAIFGIYYPTIGPYATLRLASGYLNGLELRCVLVARGISGKMGPNFAKGSWQVGLRPFFFTPLGV